MSSPARYIPESWLTAYQPSPWPYLGGFSAPVPGGGGPDDAATNYFAIAPNLTWFPHSVFEGDIYLIAVRRHGAQAVVHVPWRLSFRRTCEGV